VIRAQHGDAEAASELVDYVREKIYELAVKAGRWSLDELTDAVTLALLSAIGTFDAASSVDFLDHVGAEFERLLKQRAFGAS
jgi:hypothetical protein